MINQDNNSDCLRNGQVMKGEYTMRITKKISSLFMVGMLVIGCLMSGNTAFAASEETPEEDLKVAYIVNNDTGDQLPVKVNKVLPGNITLYSDENTFSQSYEATVTLPGISTFTSSSVTDSDKTNNVTVTLTNNYTKSGDYLTFTSVSGTVRKGTAVTITSGSVTMGHEFNGSRTEYPGGSPSFYYSTGFAKAKFTPGIYAGSNFNCTIRNSSGSWTFYLSNNIN